MDLTGLQLSKLDHTTVLKSFDCGDSDLNDFLFNKAEKFNSELLATTYLLEDGESIIAYFSIFNDSLRVEEIEFASQSGYKRFFREMVSHPKRHLKYFPAIKIGRLAVNKLSQGNGVGRIIINYVIDYAIEQNEKCACKFIIIDAYSQSLSFYEKLGFSFYQEKDKYSDTRQMYLNITPYS